MKEWNPSGHIRSVKSPKEMEKKSVGKSSALTSTKASIQETKKKQPFEMVLCVSKFIKWEDRQSWVKVDCPSN